MSTSGVTSRMTAMIKTAVEEDRAVTAEEFKSVVDYAKGWDWSELGFSDSEKKALLQPGEYLKAAGIDLSKIKFDSDALKIAEKLASDNSLELFPTINAAATSTPTPDAPAETNLREAFNQAMERGKDLGSFEEWKVRTAGADVTFKTEGAGKTWPGLVLDKLQFTDPAARDLVGENADKLSGAKTAVELKVAINEIVEAEKAYFAAEGVEVKDVNEGFGISSLRRKAFVSSLRTHVAGLSEFSAEDKVTAKGVVEGANIKLTTGHNFEMKVGSHTNYWPYWNNYLPPLEKMLDQTEEGSAAYNQIMNRIRDIHRRKTAHGRSITERDFEKSIGMALIYSPTFSEGVGQRVSVVDGSTPFSPKYELLSVANDGLPEGFEKYAGMQVVRGSDGKLLADYMGEGDSEIAKLAKSMVGKEIPAELAEKIDAKALGQAELTDLNMRDFVTGESARKDISMDWDSNGAINVARTSIGWWGHCHNEAPLNAMGIDPQKAVSVYRADRGVDTAKALVEYSSEDAWDITGAFSSDHESGYSVGSTGRGTRVDETAFVGLRNDGKHTFSLSIPGTTINIDAGLNSLEKDGEIINTETAFRENVEKEEGTF